MKTILKTILLGLTLGLVACDNVSTPKGVVAKAGRALREGNDQKFLSTLSIQYRKEFQDPAAISALREMLSIYSDLTIGNVRDLSGYQNYEVSVLGKLDGSWTYALKAYVSCETTGRRSYEPDYDNGRGRWQTDDITTCEIDGLK